jgi:hypothetical protein
MKLRVTSIALMLSLALGILFGPLNTASASSHNVFPVSGTGTTAAGIPVNFSGTFTIQKFDVQRRAVVAVGSLTGTVTDAVGTILGTVSNLATTIRLIDANASGDCQILHLELGPLDLDLLGLKVHLDKIVLDITAQPGEGNLLGNLLCAIAGLLDGGAPLNIIADLLNSLLDVLEFLRA